jgi:hypothetical protein
VLQTGRKGRKVAKFNLVAFSFPSSSECIENPDSSQVLSLKWFKTMGPNFFKSKNKCNFYDGTEFFILGGRIFWSDLLGYLEKSWQHGIRGYFAERIEQFIEAHAFLGRKMRLLAHPSPPPLSGQYISWTGDTQEDKERETIR